MRRIGLARSMVFVLGPIAAALVLSLVPTFAGGGWTDEGPGIAEWAVYRGSAFDLVYRPKDLELSPVDVVAAMEEAGARAAALLGRPWPPRDLPHRVVVAAPASASRPGWLDGVPVSWADGATAVACREAVVRYVLAWAWAGGPGAGGSSQGNRPVAVDEGEISEAIAAGLADYLHRGPALVRATGSALADRQRLASLPQLLSWWPSLPLGRAQLGCLVDYVVTGWPPRDVVALARGLPEWFSEVREVDEACVRALGVGGGDLDRGWTSHLADQAVLLAPDALEAARADVGDRLARTRADVVARAMLVLALGAVAVLGLAANRKALGLALGVFAASALLELTLFSGNLDPVVKSALALGEVGLIAAWLVWRRRREGRAAPATSAPPLVAAAPATSVVRPASAAPRPWRELAVTGALFLMIMAPRMGLYYFSREIWGKAPMIVLVLMLVFWVDRDEPGSVGLGRMKAVRLLGVVLAGLLAFRLTTGLTETIYYGTLARITGPLFVWQNYEPWWRAGGFHHFPYEAWATPKVALDIWDFFFGNFAEELFFRGYLLTRLSRAMGWWKAFVVQAVLFGFFHVNYDLFPFAPWPMLFYVLMAAAFGALMALLLRYSGSLIVPAVIHPLANLGVLWVGVHFVSYRGSWLTFLAYYPLQVLLGLAFIPLVLLLATGRLRWPASGTPGRFRRTRGPRGPYIEAPTAGG